MAASLAAIAVGTETDGSIAAPASMAALVGIKPTLGLVSRAGVIPIAHSQDTAGLTDFINGEAYGASFTSPAAVAGYPYITVPAGQVHGLPVGLSFVGTAWTEAALISIAYAYEQASLQRRAPSFAKSLNRA